MKQADSLPPPPPPAPTPPSPAPGSTWWRGIARLGSCGLLIMNLLGLAISVVVGTVVLPRFEAALADFGAELPALTTLLMSIPRAAYLVMWPTTAGGLIAKEFFISRAGTKLAINLTAALVIGAFIIFQIFALFLPLVKMIEAGQEV